MFVGDTFKAKYYVMMTSSKKIKIIFGMKRMSGGMRSGPAYESLNTRAPTGIFNGLKDEIPKLEEAIIVQVTCSKPIPLRHARVNS